MGIDLDLIFIKFGLGGFVLIIELVLIDVEENGNFLNIISLFDWCYSSF